ncbi:MAG: DUF5719 family protein [Actinomycetota bacterium]|nr:DUF5719 family protein [Actinomycetota bacterium]
MKKTPLLCRVSSIFAAIILLSFVQTLSGCGRNERTIFKEGVSGKKASSGSTYYVSPAGSNSNPGSMDDPWATPGYGSKRLKPGDTLVILGGRYVLSTYWEDMITPPSGTAQKWITITGEANNRAILAGRDNLYSAIEIGEKSYLDISNLEITSDSGANFRCGITGSEGPCSHVNLSNLYIHHIDEEAMNFGDIEHASVEKCVMSFCGFGCMGGPSGTKGGWRNVVVDRCTLSYSGHYYQGTPGPGPYDRPDGFGIENSDGPIEIKNSTSEHNRGDGLDSKASKTYIHECIVANNSCDGVKLWGSNSRVENTLIYGTGDGVGGASPWAGMVIDSDNAGANFKIINVTIHDNPAREAYPLYAQYENSTPVEILVRNTIVANGHGVPYFGSSVKLTADHNIFWRPGDSSEQLEANGRTYSAADLKAGVLGEGNLSRDPLFLKPAWGSEGDYHVRVGSPSIDGGSSLDAPSIDLDGNRRPCGAEIDIGAYEWSQSNHVDRKRTWGHGSIGATTAEKEWYFAEGSTAGGFETWLLIQNPGEDEACVNIKYITPEGPCKGPEITIAPHRRKTVNVSETLKDTWEVSTLITSDRGVIAERSMYWENRCAAHNTIGISSPEKKWYLDEGSTAGGFETWILLMNPGNDDSKIEISYLTDNGRMEGQGLVMKAETRKSINVTAAVKDTWSVSTVVSSNNDIVCERATYWEGRIGGHCSAGSNNPSCRCYIAEGSTGGEFETWILVQNPGMDEAHVTLSYLTDTASVKGPSFTLPAERRVSINVADKVPGAWSVSTVLMSDSPVVAERSMYWNNRREGHSSVGADAPSNLWYLAEGSTGHGFETWVIVQNPTSDDAFVVLTYLTDSEVVQGPTFLLEAHSRTTVNVGGTTSGSWSVSTMVDSNKPVVVERSMYGF